MNPVLLPNICALLVFIGAFRPLARRAGSHTNSWFLGWLFLMAQYAALSIGDLFPTHPTLFHLLGEWFLELVGIAFLRAAGNAQPTRNSMFLTIEMAAPILAQSALVAFNVESVWPHAFCTLLMLAPAVHIFLDRAGRTPQRTRVAWGFFLSALSLTPFAALDPALALSVIHCLLFLGSAALYWEHAAHTSPGVFTAVSGLVLWGLSYPADTLLSRFGLDSPLLFAVWQFPVYTVAYGMILTLIEDHVRHTEALAMHDVLTGLPNRRLFEDRLEQALAVAPKSGAMLACVVIDVDNFKQTNDTLGHTIGDGLLEAIATRLSWHIHPGDTLARTGGDEFAAVLTRLQSLEHLRFTVGAMMSATSVPIVVGPHAIHVGLSIGIAIYPDAAEDVDGLRRRADDAMYDAKRQGGNRFAYAGGPPDELARLLAGVPDKLPRLTQYQLHTR